MTESVSTTTVPMSPLRQRLIEDMDMRHFSRETKRNYIRDVARFSTWLGRPPDRATASCRAEASPQAGHTGHPRVLPSSFRCTCAATARSRARATRANEWHRTATASF